MNATKMITTHTHRSIEDYLNEFAGRKDMTGYDESKPIKIADENRDFVWDDDMSKDLIKSILTGYSIPSMVICNNLLMDGGNRSTVLMKWRNNEFTLKIGDWEGNYDAMIMNPILSGRWNRCAIPFTIITNATYDERCQTFENYNKGRTPTTGNLLWNRRELPLVKFADDLCYGGDFPLKDLIQKVWKKRSKKTKTRGELTFAYQTLVSSMFGPDHFHSKFHMHVKLMSNKKEEDIDLSTLKFICEVLVSADEEGLVAPKKKEEIFKKFIGAMIYDIAGPHPKLTQEEFIAKWKSFAINAYNHITKEDLKKLIDVGTSRANNQSRIECLSGKVQKYIEGAIEPIIDEDESDCSSECDEEEY